MEECEYKEVVTEAATEISVNKNKSETWKPLLRQVTASIECMISAGLWCIYFMQGLLFGAPTVIVAQIRREANSTNAVTEEMSSWLSSMPVISAVPLVLILPWICFRIGRKRTYIMVCSLSVIGFVIFYNSTSLYHVLITQVLVGPSIAAVNTFIPIVISEYTSPKYRGILLTFKSASTFWGIWVANAIGTFSKWKNIAIVAFACSTYLITVLAWPESPYWLAIKGRYAESAKSHRWLKGVNENSEKELTELLHSQKNAQKIRLTNDIDDRRCFSCFASAWSTLTSRPFYKPLLICIVLIAQYQFSGKFVTSVYAIEVLKNITQDESVAYKYMLILDGVTVFSMYGGCVLSRYFKRRTLMLTFTGAGIALLYTMALYLYLVAAAVVREHHVVIISLWTAYSVAIGCGPVILVTSIYGEIVPLRYQNSVAITVGVYTVTMMSLLIKLTPFVIRTLKMYGYYLFFAISSTITLSILYIYLPETKDKTICEIELHFIEQRLIK